MQHNLSYGNRSIGYIVVESPILTSKVRIHVHPNGVVEVEVPPESDKDEISAAVQRRVRWIFKQIEATERARTYSLPREYISGETHFYIGRRYRLRVKETNATRSAVLLKGGCIEINCPQADPAAVRRRLNEWYRVRAEDYFDRRLQDIISRISWLQNKPCLKLVSMKKQWGSCAPNGSIHLNPWLIRAPTECIDYVITHELCHLRERNHSKRYYQILSRHYPNWCHVKARLDGMAELILAA